MSLFSVPRVGVVTLVLDPTNRVLLGKRLSEHAHGVYAAPGGHLDKGETLVDCAARELLEETGIVIDKHKLKSLIVTEDFHTTEDKHYLTHYYVIKLVKKQIPQLLEPQKCESWNYYSLHELPKPLFLNTDRVLHLLISKLGRF